MRRRTRRLASSSSTMRILAFSVGADVGVARMWWTSSRSSSGEGSDAGVWSCPVPMALDASTDEDEERARTLTVSSAGSAIGSSMRNEEPAPGSDFTDRAPPMCSVRPRLRARPTPVPSMPECSRPEPVERDEEALDLVRGEAGTGVVHADASRGRRSGRDRSRRPDRPGSLYLMAFETRFNSTWRSRWRSARR